jgi:hypothetical protein
MRLETASNRKGAPAKPAADGRGVRNILSHGVSDIVPDEHMSHCGCGIVCSLCRQGGFQQSYPYAEIYSAMRKKAGFWGSKRPLRP